MYNSGVGKQVTDVNSRRVRLHFDKVSELKLPRWRLKGNLRSLSYCCRRQENIQLVPKAKKKKKLLVLRLIKFCNTFIIANHIVYKVFFFLPCNTAPGLEGKYTKQYRTTCSRPWWQCYYPGWYTNWFGKVYAVYCGCSSLQRCRRQS